MIFIEFFQKSNNNKCFSFFNLPSSFLLSNPIQNKNKNMESSPNSPLLLTSGASGRVNALLSLRALKSFILLIKAFLLLLLVPFQVFLKRCIPLVVVIDHKSSSSSSSSSTSSPKEDKDGRHSCSYSSTSSSCSSNSSYQRTSSSTTTITKSSPPPIFRFPASLYPRRSNAVVIDPQVAARRALAIKTLSANDNTCIREFSLFLNSRAETLFTQSWTPHSTINIRGVVVLLHGLNEHCGRYTDFAKKLNANGFKVYGMDWIGHGGSDGLHAYVHSLDHPAKDMKTFVEKVLKENPGIPCFCFGHSTGGAIILKAILDPKIDLRVQGVVLTSPAVRVQPAHPIYWVLAPIVSLLLPKYQLSAANKNGTCVSRDPAALIAKYSDPLVYTGSIRVRTGSEILRISSYLQQHLSRLRTPFLVLHGSDDAVTDPSASLELYERASSSDKSVKLYNGLLHDILFEPERELVAQDIIEWLNSRVKV